MFLLLQGLGIAHVLTGLDHMSAVATLSAGVPHWSTAFALGVRWGVGHSTGLLLVGITLIVLDYRRTSDDHPSEEKEEEEASYGDDLNHDEEEEEKTVNVPDLLSQVFESLVGVFMIVLGLYGVRRALYNNRTFSTHRSHHPSHEEQDDDNETNVIDEEDLEAEEEEDDEDVAETQGDTTTTTPPTTTTTATAAATTTTTTTTGTEAVEQEEDGRSSTTGTSTAPTSPTSPTTTTTLFRNISVKLMAFLAGIIHGLAGPGGVLGVIPAVQLKDWKLACIYLSSFCITSTLTMGCFACLYGKVTSSCGGKGTNIEFRIQCGSAGLSILVGITWLVLSSLGQLDAVFH
jgi:hypothetical protein